MTNTLILLGLLGLFHFMVGSIVGLGTMRLVEERAGYGVLFAISSTAGFVLAEAWVGSAIIQSLTWTLYKQLVVVATIAGVTGFGLVWALFEPSPSPDGTKGGQQPPTGPPGGSRPPGPGPTGGDDPPGGGPAGAAPAPSVVTVQHEGEESNGSPAGPPRNHKSHDQHPEITENVREHFIQTDDPQDTATESATAERG